MGKRISVIVPGFNNPKKWWRRCVASVRAACDADDEIVCVDDGSSVPVDQSWVFADVDSRTRLCRKVNGGLSSARNFGLERVKGRYVAFIDSDDEIRPETFNRCIEKMEQTGSDICVYGLRTIWVDEGLVKDDVPIDVNYGLLSPSDAWSLVNARLFNYAWNKVYRREFLARNNLAFDVDGMPCEDVIFNLQCVMAGAKWCSVDYVGYIYYRCGMTLLSTYKPSNAKGLRNCSEVWREYKCFAADARTVFGDFGEIDEKGLASAEWANLWKPKSPLGISDKYKWLKKHGEAFMAGKSLLLEMARAMVFSFARRHLYFRPIRRWNIKRQYSHAVDWKGFAG